MEEKKKGTWTKILLPLCIILLIIGIWQIIVLKLLSMGIINTGLAMVFVTLGTVVIFAIIFFILKSIIDQVRAIVEGPDAGGEAGRVQRKAQKLAQRGDELGRMVRSLQDSVRSFAQVIAGIKLASVELGEVSEEFSQIFTNMTTAVEHTGEAVAAITGNTVSQAESTADMKDKIISIGASIDRISENIEALTKSAENMRDCNRTAEQIMAELISISRNSGEEIENVRVQTERTNQSAQQIRTATDIIAGISNQTNLLALNASIEAARAGEHGRGFAVVAEEIRTLADQSRESTDQINQIVNDLIGNSDISVEITQKVSEAVIKQNQKIRDTEEIFQTLNEEISLVSDSIEGIGTEIEELDSHKDVIEHSIASLADSAEQNAGSAGVTAESMEEFRQIVDECNHAREKVVHVSDELVGYIKKVNVNAVKEKLSGH